MIRKLIFFGVIILIGLSLGIIKACVLFGFEENDPLYIEEYVNETQSDVKFVYVYFNGIPANDTISILAQDSLRLGFAYNGDKPIEGGVSSLGVHSTAYVIELHANGEVKQIWTKPAGYFGDTINSPFNYDSWVLEMGNFGDGTSGKITFTITDSDLE